MASTPDQRTLPGDRLPPGHAAGTRPDGLRGWVVLLRRRARARLQGRQYADQLIAQGMSVGRQVVIADSSCLDPGFARLISIGDQTTIGPGATILTHHAAPKLRSGHSAIAPGRIGARAFVGANAVILPGVAIGDDAIAGAGSVVRRDMASGVIVFGNPAQEVGTTDAHTERHLMDLERWPGYPAIADPGEAESRRILDELGDGPGYVW